MSDFFKHAFPENYDFIEPTILDIADKAKAIMQFDNPLTVFRRLRIRCGSMVGLHTAEDYDGSQYYVELSKPIELAAGLAKVLNFKRSTNSGVQYYDRVCVEREFPYEMKLHERNHQVGRLVLTNRLDLPSQERFPTAYPLDSPDLRMRVTGKAVDRVDELKLFALQEVLTEGLDQRR